MASENASWRKYATKVELDNAEDDVDEFTIRNVNDAFQKVRQLGQGTYGKVYLAKDKRTGEEVALKKIKLEASKEKREGFPITAIREIRVLMSLDHPNVIELKEIVRSNIKQNNNFKGSIYLVFEYMQHDLAGLHERVAKNLDPRMVKWFVLQTLQGLEFCHKNSVLHRDLKTSNLLINDDGTLKLADFGLARPRVRDEMSDGQLTSLVCTLWYRPPELLLGSQKYGGEVDIWSTGCILYELLVGKPLFPGDSDATQLDLIFAMLGTPTHDTWPKAEHLKFWHSVIPGKYSKNKLRKHLEDRHLSADACDLLEGMLQLNPEKRLSASQALAAPYFRSHPHPMTSAEFRKSNFAPSHEYIVKGKDKRKLQDSSDRTSNDELSPPAKKQVHSRGRADAPTAPLPAQPHNTAALQPLPQPPQHATYMDGGAPIPYPTASPTAAPVPHVPPHVPVVAPRAAPLHWGGAGHGTTAPLSAAVQLGHVPHQGQAPVHPLPGALPPHMQFNA